MSMIKNPVRGMRDFTPSEMVLREYILNIIENVATKSGYQKIETPAMEHIENLTSKEGGENESLIFKILKRGDSLSLAKANGDELADSGLRYDLTVPLARYFANNQNNLPMPFKSFQIGPVWRADRPQKGRYRQFLQCDMDILGDKSILAEIDTIVATTEILASIFSGLKAPNITVHLNDRRILTAAARYAGFNDSDVGSVLISLDKNDKIGLSGVAKELLKFGYSSDKVEKFIKLFDNLPTDFSVYDFCKQLEEFAPDKSIIDDIEKIAGTVSQAVDSSASIIFNPTLVRGMGYYTGPIFECSVSGLSSSVAGGGRYDKMIGKFSGGNDVSACGFSIGFERIIAILDDAGFVPEKASVRTAILVDQNITQDQLKDIFARANLLRYSGTIVSVLSRSKNVNHQIEMLQKCGYDTFEKVYKDDK